MWLGDTEVISKDPDLNMSHNETLSYRDYWEPHLDLDPTLAKEAHTATTRWPLSHLIRPVDSEIFI